MTIADGYGRFSSDAQERGSSKDRQIEGIKAFIEKQGWTLGEIIFDDGVSAAAGGNLKHGPLAKYAEAAGRGEKRGRMLVLEAPDRFSRASISVSVHFLLGLLNDGVSVAFWASGDIVSQDAKLFDLLRPMMGLESASSENESRRGRLLVHHEKARELLAEGEPPTARAPDWIILPRRTRKGETGRVAVEHPMRGPLVREIFEKAADGMRGYRLAEWLNRQTDERYKPWRGRAWTADMVTNLLTNRAVLGFYQPHKIEHQRDKPTNAKGKHPIKRIPVGPEVRDVRIRPQVVSDELWNRVQSARKRDGEVKTGRPSKRGLVNLFAGLCRCGVCAGSMHMVGRNARGKNDWLVCGAARSGACSNRAYYSLTRLERGFLRHGFDAYLQASDFAQPDSRADRVAADLDAARLEMEQHEKAIRNFERQVARADDDETADHYSGLLKRERATMRIVEKRIADLDNELAVARGNDPEESFRRAEILVSDALYREDNHDARVRMAALMRALVKQMDFADGKVFITPVRPKRRLVVEFLEGSRGRRVVTDAEKISIEFEAEFPSQPHSPCR